MIKIVFGLLLILLSSSVFGQSDQEKAKVLCLKAIKEMDGGKINEAIDLLEEAKKLDPNNIDFPYEIAFAHYLNGKYSNSIKILKGILKHKDANDRVWQMLGNCYDMDKNPGKAIETYDEGLKKFPNSGVLYLERGNMELINENYDAALGFYEKGIEVQPQFSSNYYWASRLYLSSSEKVWGMIYGEIFMNLERNSKRTSEISKLLYDTYKSEISFSSDSSLSVSFCKQMTMNVSDFSEGKEFKLPFCMIYEPTLGLSVVFVKEINVNSLSHIRSTFIENYYKLGHDKKYPNVLFDYQKHLKEKGYLEAYSHWVLMKGDETDFGIWYEDNKEKWEAFMDWYSDNPIEINEKRRFFREQY